MVKDRPWAYWELVHQFLPGQVSAWPSLPVAARMMGDKAKPLCFRQEKGRTGREKGKIVKPQEGVPIK